MPGCRVCHQPREYYRPRESGRITRIARIQVRVSKSVVIVDLGTGNLRSVAKAVSWVSPKSEIMVTSRPDVIAGADHLILPGQGAIGTWFEQLSRDRALFESVQGRLHAGPVLGICLGLQALYRYSSESGGTQGLGILPGDVRHFSEGFESAGIDMANSGLKVPHMGWNRVWHSSDHPLWEGIKSGERFYFVHSYYALGEDQVQVMGQCEFGIPFTAAAGRGNLFALQFHPEKSQQAGLTLIRNFINWNGAV